MSILSNTLLVKSSAVVSWLSLPLIARMACGGDTVASARAAACGRTPGEELRPHLDDVEELVAIDAAVSVHVVEFEVPAQFVLHLSPHHQAESGDVLHEVYVAVLQKREVLLNQTRARAVGLRPQDCLQAQSENRQLPLHRSTVSANLPV